MKLVYIYILVSIYLLGAAQNRDSLIYNSDEFTGTNFFKNKYLEFTSGTQILFSRDAGILQFTDRFTPSLSASMGADINRFLGINMKIQGFSLNGFSTTEGIYELSDKANSTYEEDPVRAEVNINPDGTYRHFIRYANLSLNLYSSFKKIFAAKFESSKFDFFPSIGIGNMHVFNYKGIPGKNTLSKNIGLGSKVKISSKFDLSAQVLCVYFDNSFEGRLAGNKKNENYKSLNIGLMYNIR